MSEPCGECNGCKHLSARHEELRETVKEYGRVQEAHGHKIDALRSAQSNTGRSIETINERISELLNKFATHEQQESVKIEGLKKLIQNVKEEVLAAIKPIKVDTDKNSFFIFKVVYAISVIGATLGAIAWLMSWLNSHGLLQAIYIMLTGG